MAECRGISNDGAVVRENANARRLPGDERDGDDDDERAKLIPPVASRATASSSETPTSLHLSDAANPEGGLAGGGGRAKNLKEALRRLRLATLVAASQFSSGYVAGYVLSVIWGALRGRPTDSALWAFEFGAIPAIFGGCAAAAKVLFDAEEGSVRSVTIRNVALSLFFARNRGWRVMIRNAGIYGGLTYYFVSKKVRRDGIGGGGPQQAAAMAELLRQMTRSANQNGFVAGGVGGAPPANVAELLERMNHMAGGTMPSVTKQNQTKTTIRMDEEANVLDVEWSEVDPAVVADDEENI
eukprot:CAMPEP_0172534682 /NCGR_PEP_ID=MMETSP1067-20121228/6956_1 /TAXON_ID=265564 ORGANISM="Thalassiosira punctigera, Strain Tpunct2005C2" /NCGR_SAMPLE_ID=MMETSP1067 /ASSEMBLY_ACC=CAM_ASM_000444 /LENGTH=297 /DNA_ID=CAMNT_0013319499 /DNA_START=67 /DNA_END=961 /DNA_ORIENTATION=-